MSDLVMCVMDKTQATCRRAPAERSDTKQTSESNMGSQTGSATGSGLSDSAFACIPFGTVEGQGVTNNLLLVYKKR